MAKIFESFEQYNKLKASDFKNYESLKAEINLARKLKSESQETLERIKSQMCPLGKKLFGYGLLGDENGPTELYDHAVNCPICKAITK